MKMVILLFFVSLLFIGCSKDDETPSGNQDVKDPFITGKWQSQFKEGTDSVYINLDLSGKDTSCTGTGKAFYHVIWNESGSSSFTGDVDVSGTYDQTRINLTIQGDIKYTGTRAVGTAANKYIGKLTIKYWGVGEKEYNNIAFSKIAD